MAPTHSPGALRSWSRALLFTAVPRGRAVNLEGCRNTSQFKRNNARNGTSGLVNASFG